MTDLRNQDGSLPFAMLTILAVTSLVVILVSRVILELDQTNQDREFHGAVLGADAGVQQALSQIQQLSDNSVATLTDSGSINDVDFEWEATRVGSVWQVQSWGTDGESDRKVEAEVQRPSTLQHRRVRRRGLHHARSQRRVVVQLRDRDDQHRQWRCRVQRLHPHERQRVRRPDRPVRRRRLLRGQRLLDRCRHDRPQGPLQHRCARPGHRRRRPRTPAAGRTRRGRPATTSRSGAGETYCFSELALRRPHRAGRRRHRQSGHHLPGRQDDRGQAHRGELHRLRRLRRHAARRVVPPDLLDGEHGRDRQPLRVRRGGRRTVPRRATAPRPTPRPCCTGR